MAPSTQPDSQHESFAPNRAPVSAAGRASALVWLLVAALATLALFQQRPWRPLEVFDSDPGGYYAYLPAAFIYHDLGRPDSLYQIAAAVKPGKTRSIGLHRVENGNSISKYPLGVALTQLPWFAGAHAYAHLHGDPPDGFSRPYQHSIMLSGLVYGLLGLWVLRKLLRRFFADAVVAWTLAGVGLGTNFLAYASYEAGMAHAVLFMWQAALLYCTVRWYETPRWRWALGMGLFLGLAVLCRFTEALYVVVPLTWGLTSGAALRQRPARWWAYAGQLAGAGALAAAVVSLQFVFWHTVTGHWFVDSYPGERFDFAHPHVLYGLFSYRKGWLLYTPLAGLMLLGLWPAGRRLPAVVAPVLLLLPVLLYLTFSWEAWWYGGGFSARPLISLYPLLALPLAALLDQARRPWRAAARVAVGLCIVLNLWQTWQFAAGALLADQTTGERYWRNFFRARP